MWTREIGLWFLLRDEYEDREPFMWPWEQPEELLRHDDATVRRFADWMRQRCGAPSRLNYQRMGVDVRERWVDLWMKRDPPTSDNAEKFGGLSTIRAGVLSALGTHLPELE